MGCLEQKTACDVDYGRHCSRLHGLALTFKEASFDMTFKGDTNQPKSSYLPRMTNNKRSAFAGISMTAGMFNTESSRLAARCAEFEALHSERIENSLE